MKTRGWKTQVLIGATLAVAAFAVAYLQPEPSVRAEQKPAVVELSPSGGIAGPRLPRANVAAEPTAGRPQADADEEPQPGFGGVPVFHPRDPQEWQGMLVNTAVKPFCDRSSRCGLAMACLEGQCGPCAADQDCGEGEACVLDHCVPAKQVSCRSRTDCTGEEELCVLTGHSADPRGNASMKAECRSSRGGAAPESMEPEPGEPPFPGDLPEPALLPAVREHAKAANP